MSAFPAVGVEKKADGFYVDTRHPGISYLRIGKPSGKASMKDGYWAVLDNKKPRDFDDPRFPTIRAAIRSVRGSPTGRR